MSTSTSTENRSWQEWISMRPAEPPRGDARRALLIAYQFPPVGGSGVQRAAKLAKYLPQFGWNLEVLTAGHHRFPWHDLTLVTDLPGDLQIHPVNGYEPACIAQRLAAPLATLLPNAQDWLEDRLYWRLCRLSAGFGCGNGESWWTRPAIRAGLSLHRRTPFDAVISTGPPHFTHAVARAIAARAKLPWIADLRDPLTSDFDRTSAPTHTQVQQAELEAAITRDAQILITTTQALATDLAQRFPYRANSIHCITNGFDREDFSPLADPSFDPADECVFLASGSFYGRRELARLFEPMQQVLTTHPEWKSRVRLILVGTIDAEQRRAIAAHHPAWLQVIDYVEHARAIQLAAQATCSIVMVPDCQHGRLSIPAKTFELIALPRHLLALAPAGCETEAICQRVGACTTAPLEDPDAVAGAIERIAAAHFAGTLSRTRYWDKLDRYDRRTLAREFARRLDEISGRPRGRCLEHGAEQELDFVLARLSSRSTGTLELTRPEEDVVEIR